MSGYRPPLYLAYFFLFAIVITVFSVFHGLLRYAENRLTLNEYTRFMLNDQRRNINQALYSKFSVQADLDALAASSIPSIYETEGMAGVEQYLLSNLNYFDEISATFFTTAENEFSGYVRQADYLHMYSGAHTDYAIKFAKTNANGIDGDVVNSREGFFASQRPWYGSALNKETAGFSSVFTYHAYATLALPHSLPVLNDSGHVLGVVGSNIFLGQFGGLLQEMMEPVNGVAVILDEQGRLIASSLDVSPIIAQEDRSDMIMAKESDNVFVKSAYEQETFRRSNPLDAIDELPEILVEDKSYKTATFRFSEVPNLNWQVTLFVPRQAFHQTTDQLMWRMGMVLVFTLLLALTLIWWFSKRISYPLSRLVERFSFTEQTLFEENDLDTHQLELKEVKALKSASIDYQSKLQSYVDTLKDQAEENNRQLAQIQKLALVSQSIDDMSLILTVDNQIDWANEPFFDYFGLDESSVNQKLPLETELLQQLNTSAQSYWENSLNNNFKAEQDNQYFEFRFFPLVGETEHSKALILIHDVTAQVNYQQQLTIWKQVFESTIVGIAVSMGNNQYIDVVNSAFAEIYGGMPEDYEGADMSTFYPDDAEIGPEQLRELVNDKGELAVEVENLRKNGERFPAFLTATFIRNQNGDVLAKVATITDLTESKQLQQELFQSQKMHAIGSLAGGIVHDMNNVLGAIMGNAELGLIYSQGDGGIPLDKTQRLFESVLKAAERGTKLSQQILAFTRMEAVKMSPVPINALLKDTIELVQATLPSKIALSYSSSLQNTDAINGNESQLQQVFLNLMNNAIKAIKKSSIAKGRLEVAVSSDNQVLNISISDNGAGIPQDIQAFIFDPFFSTEAKGKGTGLGLAIVKRIVKSHGGSIQVNSTEGVGTRFDLTFTLMAVTEQDEKKGQSLQKDAKPNSHVVIVDDDEDLLSVWAEIFETRGAVVKAFSRSKDALDYVAQHYREIDCIFTDYDMPDMDGETLCTEIRKHSQDVKIVMSTGYSELMNEERARVLGISKLLFKPVSFDVLFSELSGGL